MKLISIIIAALFTQNFVMVKFMGICPFLGVSKKKETAIGMGMAVIFVMAISSAITYFVNQTLLVPYQLEYLQTIVFILIIAGLVQFVEMFVKKSMPALYNALGIYLPLITTNCAILGSALLCIQNDYSFIPAVVFSFGSALGFTMAIVIFSFVRERVALAETPVCFKGTPIALVTAGLIAMAFSGFTSIKLPF